MRHVADKHDGESRKRVERYAEIERKSAPEGSHRATQEVHRRPKDRHDGARLAQYARVERGEEA